MKRRHQSVSARNESEFKALLARIVAAGPAEAELAALRGIGRLLDREEVTVLEAMWALPSAPAPRSKRGRR